ncbi:MAG: RNA polymerase sigma factor [Hydrogenophaga sp.]
MQEPRSGTTWAGTMATAARWIGGTRTPVSGALDDWALWRAACKGDAPSATQLVRLLTPQAHGLAMQLVGRHEDAEDLVQESFLRLWGSNPSDTRGASLATFFNTIVINRCKSWLVRHHELSTEHEVLIELADAAQVAHGPHDSEGASLPPHQLQAAMARLPSRQRMALAMWAYADADVATIARSLQIDSNAAHQLLHRAKTALRQLLQETPP